MEDIKEIKEKLGRHKEESVACRDMAGLKLRVRCHSEAPGCLIFYHVMPALWIWCNCPLKTFVMHIATDVREDLSTELFSLSKSHVHPPISNSNFTVNRQT